LRSRPFRTLCNQIHRCGGILKIHIITKIYTGIRCIPPSTTCLGRKCFPDAVWPQVPEVPPSVAPVLPSLSVLRLGSNRLTSLPEGSFSACPALTKLYLDNNVLHSLNDHSFSGLSKLEVSMLALVCCGCSLIAREDASNPWACTCSLGYFHRYLGEYELNFYVRDGLVINNDADSVVSPTKRKRKTNSKDKRKKVFTLRTNVQTSYIPLHGTCSTHLDSTRLFWISIMIKSPWYLLTKLFLVSPPSRFYFFWHLLHIVHHHEPVNMEASMKRRESIAALRSSFLYSLCLKLTEESTSVCVAVGS
uniref:Uncharacterized protein n=1 Tax=Sander lucioperca TaxID=283035 RepID=A0A8C9X7P8_SANLU